MNSTHYDIGQQAGGSTVRVELSGTEANVMLLDTVNLSNYRAGRPFNYYGGHFDRSPAIIGVPRTAHWHVVVDLGGFGGSVRSTCEVFPPSALV